jgi:hypothetical protein
MALGIYKNDMEKVVVISFNHSSDLDMERLNKSSYGPN